MLKLMCKIDKYMMSHYVGCCLLNGTIYDKDRGGSKNVNCMSHNLWMAPKVNRLAMGLNICLNIE